MIKFQIYELIHFIGIFTVLFAFGSLFSEKGYNKKAAIGHGVGLLLILLGGFGMAAVMKVGFPTWLILKLVVWVCFGGAIVLAKREVLKGLGAWIFILGLAAVAAFIGIHK